MIIWLASYPRSGNTFFRTAMNHLYGVKTYSIYDDLLLSKIKADEMVGHEALPAPLEELSRVSDIYLVKTHDLPTDDNPAIYLVRDGRDSVLSFSHYRMAYEEKKQNLMRRLLKPRRFNDVLRETIIGKCHYGRWGDNVSAWTTGRSSAKTSILKFEALIDSPAEAIDECLRELSLDIKPVGGTLPTFEELHEQWPDFFRQGKTGSWREEMSEEIHDLFWEYHRQAMNDCVYQR